MRERVALKRDGFTVGVDTVCGHIHCPRVGDCVTSQRCASGCAIVSSAEKKSQRHPKLNPLKLRCNLPILMPMSRAQFLRYKRMNLKS